MSRVPDVPQFTGLSTKRLLPKARVTDLLALEASTTGATDLTARSGGPAPPAPSPQRRPREYRESSPPPPRSKTVKGRRGGSAHVRSTARSVRRPDPAPCAPRPGPALAPAWPGRTPWALQVSAGPARFTAAPAPPAPRTSPVPNPPPRRARTRAAPRSPRRRRPPASSFRKSRHFGSLPSPPRGRRFRARLQPASGLR